MPIPKSIYSICILFSIFTIALNPPLLKLYNCANFALNNINKFIKGQGYAVSKFRLKINKQTPPTVCKIWLQYTKGRSYKKTFKKHLTRSCITNCLFVLTIIYTAIGWQVEVQDFTYNYKACMHSTALLHYCQRTEEIKKIIVDILASSIIFSKILTSLLKKDITISLKNIYNKQQLNKKQLLSRLTLIYYGPYKQDSTSTKRELILG